MPYLKIFRILSQSRLSILSFNKKKKFEPEKKIRKEHLQGPIIRSRAKRIDEGEKPRTYICSLEYISQFLKQKYLMS